jgi:hypothetical protein
MRLSFTIAAGPRQRSYSQVWVPQDSRPHFTVSDLTLTQPGGPGTCIYIPQEQDGPVIPPGTGFSSPRPIYDSRYTDAERTTQKIEHSYCFVVRTT